MGQYYFLQGLQVLMNLMIMFIEEKRLMGMLQRIFNVRNIDFKLMVPVMMLLIIGYMMIFSTTSLKGVSEYADAYFFIKRHSIYLGVGVILYVIGFIVPIQFFQRVAWIGYLISLGLLLLTLIIKFIKTCSPWRK